MGAFHRFGCILYRRRWPVLIAWAVVILAALPLAPRVFSVLGAGGFSSPDLEAERAGDLLTERFQADPANLFVIYQDPRGDLLATDPGFQAQVEASLVSVRALTDVAAIITPAQSPRQIAPDARTAYATISLRRLPEDYRVTLPAVESALRARPTELQTTLTGSPVFYADIQEVTERDLRRAELISLPFAGVALFVIFGSVVAAAVPGLVGGAAVLLTLALMVLLAQTFNLSIFSLNLTTMLGLGLGIDYSLFVVSRFREELAQHQSVENAVAQSVATAGRAVLYSGVTVFVGLLGLLLFDFNALRSLGVAGAMVVALCVLAALTLLPPLLGIIGHRIDALSVRSLMQRVRPATSAAPRHSPGFWARLADMVMMHPWRTLIPVFVALIGLGAPFLRVEFGAPDATVLPRDVQSRRGVDLLRERFGEGEISPTLIVFQTSEGGSPLTPVRVGALYDFMRRVQADPRVERSESIVTLDPRLTRVQYQLVYDTPDPNQIGDAYARAAAQATVRGDTVVARVTSRFSQTDDRSKALVRSIRATPPPEGFKVLVGGATAGVVDYADRLYADFPRAALFVVAAIYVVLLLTFRSVLLPIKAIVMNVLSILASYGALVVVFQEGALSGLLRFEPLGFVEASLPIVMFCVLFGLSMDYEVFLLSRVKEAYDRGASNTESVAQGIERSGRMITSAAAIVILVSLSFVFADIVLIKALGLGTAIAVFLDATVVRALLVPATMRLLGDWNWWAPGWLRRILPSGGLHSV